VYALKVTEFREALVLCCLRRAVAPNTIILIDEIRRLRRKSRELFYKQTAVSYS